MSYGQRSRHTEEQTELKSQGQLCLGPLGQPCSKKRIFKQGRRYEGRHRRTVRQSLADLTTVSSLLKKQASTLPFLEPGHSPPQHSNQAAKPAFSSFEQFQPLRDYLGSIGEHLFSQEARLPMPQASLLTFLRQDLRMRSLGLIVAFCQRFSFKTETVFMAFGIFQRLCVPEFQKYHLALRTCASLFIAAKYQEIAVPRAQIFAKMDPEQSVEKQNLLKLESEVLLNFEFNLGFPSPLHFINLLVARYSLQAQIRNVIVRICQASIRSQALWGGPSSLLALACLQFVVPGLIQGEEGGPQLQRELQWRCVELRRLDY